MVQDVKGAGPGLLVSVRSVAEAAAALAGGAEIIDVKEPTRGPLGWADPEVVEEIGRFLEGRVLMSAALGELRERIPVPRLPLDFVKWGLAGYRGRPQWRETLSRLMAELSPGTNPVVVAYADWAKAEGPPVDEVVTFAMEQGRAAFLLDTYSKETDSQGRSKTLLDWLSAKQITCVCRQCRQAGIPVALAGSLGVEQILALQEARPRWFAVRGAACEGGREGTVSAQRVQQLAELVGGLSREKP